MDTRKATTEYRMAQWGQMVATRQASGQSIQEFCATTGVSRNTYFYWQRKLRESACRELATRGEEEAVVPNGWARIAEPKAECAAEDVSIEVGGCRVTATENTNLELLAKICQALRAL